MSLIMHDEDDEDCIFLGAPDPAPSADAYFLKALKGFKKYVSVSR
jgi:hypothetical protein